MKSVNLGRTGLKVSRLCLGCMTYGESSRGRHTWTLAEEPSRVLIRQALYADYDVADRAIIEAVADVAQAREVPRAQVALAWVLGKPEVTSPIIGASRAGHLEDTIAAMSIQLSPEEVQLLEAPYRPRAIVGQ